MFEPKTAQKAPTARWPESLLTSRASTAALVFAGLSFAFLMQMTPATSANLLISIGATIALLLRMAPIKNKDEHHG